MTKKKIRRQPEDKMNSCSPIAPERADELYELIIHVMIVKKKYRDKTFSAVRLAQELNTNHRYVSLVLTTRFHMNYSSFVNKLRVAEAVNILVDARYRKYTVEDVGSMVGFSNRQAFYTAFHKFVGTTPRAYRVAHLKA